MNAGCTFDDDFQRLVAPRLVSTIQAEAAHVAWGTYDYETAVDEVMVAACFYGAAYLSDNAFTDLRHWVVEQLASVLDQELMP